MKTISLVLFFLLFTTFNLNALAQRRVPDRTSSAGEAGAKLLETDLYELYECLTAKWCNENQAFVSLVFKVKEGYVILDDDTYLRRFEKEILPVIRQRCKTATRIILSNYIKGVRIGTGLKERPLNSFLIEINPQGEMRYLHTTRQVTRLVELRKESEQREQDKTQAATVAVTA